MISTEEQHELSPEQTEEVFPIKLDNRDLENAPFPSEVDRARVVEFLKKSFGDLWESMPEGEKKDEIERNMEQGLSEVKAMMGEKWDALSDTQRRDLFDTLFVEKAKTLEPGLTVPQEQQASGPAVEAPQPQDIDTSVEPEPEPATERESSSGQQPESEPEAKEKTGFEFTEGPVWHPDGHLLFVDIRRSLIHRLVPGGQPEVFRDNSGSSNGLTFDLQGRLIMCEGDNRRVTRMEPDGAITTVAAACRRNRQPLATPDPYSSQVPYGDKRRPDPGTAGSLP